MCAQDIHAAQSHVHVLGAPLVKVSHPSVAPCTYQTARPRRTPCRAAWASRSPKTAPSCHPPGPASRPAVGAKTHQNTQPRQPIIRLHIACKPITHHQCSDPDPLGTDQRCRDGNGHDEAVLFGTEGPRIEPRVGKALSQATQRVREDDNPVPAASGTIYNPYGGTSAGFGSVSCFCAGSYLRIMSFFVVLLSVQMVVGCYQISSGLEYQEVHT